MLTRTNTVLVSAGIALLVVLTSLFLVVSYSSPPPQQQQPEAQHQQQHQHRSAPATTTESSTRPRNSGGDDDDYWCKMKTTFRSDFDAKSSATGENWRHRTCPITRKVTCGRRTAKPTGKALVLYTISDTENQFDRNVDFDNLRLFLSTAVLSPGESTQLFEGADYVFIRVRDPQDRSPCDPKSASGYAPGHVRPGDPVPGIFSGKQQQQQAGGIPVPPRQEPEVEECMSKDNLRFVFVSGSVCNSCAYARVLWHLGLTGDVDGMAMRANNNKNNNRYRQVFFLSSAVRGPFVSDDSSHFLDTMTIGNRDRVSNQLGEEDEEEPPLVANVGSISWEGKPHPQTFAMSVPVRMLREIVPHFLGMCGSSRQRDCAFNGEMRIGDKLWAAGHALYSFSKNFTFRHLHESAALNRAHGAPAARPNPTTYFIDPCMSIFALVGGDVYKHRLIPQSVLRAIQLLTLGMTGGATSFGVEEDDEESPLWDTFAELAPRRGCQFF